MNERNVFGEARRKDKKEEFVKGEKKKKKNDQNKVKTENMRD